MSEIKSSRAIIRRFSALARTSACSVILSLHAREGGVILPANSIKSSLLTFMVFLSTSTNQTSQGSDLEF
jgi:hypothetical protein